MNFRNLFIIYILLFIKTCIVYSENSENIELKAIVYSFYDLPNSYYTVITNAFNEYSIENGLNITVKMTVLSPQISTADLDDYGTTIDSLLLKKNQKYDMFFYFSTYSKKYASHLVNLRDYLSEEYINVFDENVLKNGCSSYNDELIALPVYMDISVLLSNQELLARHGKEIPKTWDELMSTSKYIYEEEQKLNNTIIRYHSSMNVGSGSASLCEFINSYRDSNSSPYPEITSKEAYNALIKLKEMKDEIGEVEFSEPEEPLIPHILYGSEITYLFIRYFYMMHIPLYKASALPGQKEGVTGTFVKSTNLSIGKNISEDRKKAAVEYLKFVASKETQKKYIINNFLYSAMTELYDEEDVCSIIECNVIKEASPLAVENNDIDYFADDIYFAKYRDYLLDYIYKDKPLSDAITKIDDMRKIYKFSLTTSDSSSGLITFIIFLVISVCMILSLIFIFIKKFEPRFGFLSKDSWVLTTLGSVILMSSMVTLYGKTSSVNCHIKVTLINMGFALSICPSLHKLISNFPITNKISAWFEENKYIFILVLMLLTGGLNGILAISSYDVRQVVASERNYEKCIMNNKFGNVMYYIVQAYDILIALVSLFLIFMEWNLEETVLDVKYLATALFMDILSLVLLNILDKIKFDYSIYNVLLSVNIIFFAVSNHLFTYLIRALALGSNGSYEESRKILRISNTSSSKKFSVGNASLGSNKIDHTSTSVSVTSSSKSKTSGITQKIMSIHNQTSRA